MTVDDDLGRATAAAAALRRAVATLQDRLGETVDVRRLADDVTRVESDLELLRAATGGRGPAAAPADVVYIPEGEYDPSLFAGADDELGPHGRA
ncbi:MAG: hypothetical protein ACFCVG_06115 [Kineosporiaceae bacterium]